MRAYLSPVKYCHDSSKISGQSLNRCLGNKKDAPKSVPLVDIIINDSDIVRNWSKAGIRRPSSDGQ